MPQSDRGEGGAPPTMGQSPMLRIYAAMDGLRQAQAMALGALGFGSAECRYRILARGPHWRLRRYEGAGTGVPLLLAPAPIKRPYVWDLCPEVSVIRRCLSHRRRVYLIEWASASDSTGDAGLDTYADHAIAAAVAAVIDDTGGAKPFLIGHSLGGTLATVFAALNPGSLRGLVLLGAPLCFEPGASPFRDAVVRLAPPGLAEAGSVPGSLLSLLSAVASPATFVWSRLADAAFGIADPGALGIQARVERWTLDEMALPGRLVHELLHWLYRENRLCRGTLVVGGKAVRLSNLQLPMLVIIDTADEIAPPAAVTPLVEAVGHRDLRLIEYPGEGGVGLQHLALLVGRQAHAQIWPQIMKWMDARR